MIMKREVDALRKQVAETRRLAQIARNNEAAVRRQLDEKDAEVMRLTIENDDLRTQLEDRVISGGD